jgi:ParB-like nuclease domain
MRTLCSKHRKGTDVPWCGCGVFNTPHCLDSAKAARPRSQPNSFLLRYKVGQLSPILVRRVEGPEGRDLVLVAGRHRLRAATILEWFHIEGIVVEYDDVKSRLVEIAENLHRSDLTVVERSEHVAEWIRLTEDNSSQVVKKGRPGVVHAAESYSGRKPHKKAPHERTRTGQQRAWPGGKK